jgi:hypothetical protein
MVRTTVSFLALLGALLPGIILAQDPRLVARLDPATRAPVERLADSARTAGLPSEPLIQKALEGASKRAPGPRIVTAVAHVLESLRGARGVLGTDATSDELVAGAASLRAGASPTMLRELQQLSPRDGLAVPLAVLTDLVVSGVTVDAAWRSVERLAQRGARDMEFLELRDRIGEEAVDRPRSRTGAPSLRFAAEGALARTAPLGEGATGTLSLAAFPAVFPTAFGRIQPEIAGSVSARTHDHVYGAHGWDVSARLHAASDRRGLWGGIGLGDRSAGRSARAARRIDIGGWTRVGPTTVRVWLAQATFDDSVRVSGSPTPLSSSDSLRPAVSSSGSLGSATRTLFLTSYTDVGSRLSLPLFDRYELEGSLARRFSREQSTTAWRLGGTMGLGSNVALVAAMGHAAPDLPAALPGGHYTTVGFRFLIGAPGASTPPVVPAAHRDSGAGGAATAGAAEAPATVEVRAGGRLIIVAPAAETVDAMGDFTDWQPTPLVRTAEGRWEYPRPVPAGVHQFNVRLSGGAWIVPNGASAVDDGFGGRTGLVVVRP